MKRLTLDDVMGLPELDFQATRKITKPIEYGKIAPVRKNESLIKFEDETIIFGFYRDIKSGENYLVHSKSLRPFGGFPECDKFSDIHEYVKTRDYSEL